MFKLTLRDLFAFVTIAALALGWLVDRSALATRNQALVTENSKLTAQNAEMGMNLLWATTTLEVYQNMDKKPPLKPPVRTLSRGSAQ